MTDTKEDKLVRSIVLLGRELKRESFDSWTDGLILATFTDEWHASICTARLGLHAYGGTLDALEAALRAQLAKARDEAWLLLEDALAGDRRGEQ